MMERMRTSGLMGLMARPPTSTFLSLSVPSTNLLSFFNEKAGPNATEKQAPQLKGKHFNSGAYPTRALRDESRDEISTRNRYASCTAS